MTSESYTPKLAFFPKSCYLTDRWGRSLPGNGTRGGANHAITESMGKVGSMPKIGRSGRDGGLDVCFRDDFRGGAS